MVLKLHSGENAVFNRRRFSTEMIENVLNFRRFHHVKFSAKHVIMLIQILHFEEGSGVMYQCGDMVLYGIHGVCKVVGLEVKTVDRKKIEYYVLEPLSQDGASYFVPAHNEAAVAKLSPLMTKQELDALLHSCTDMTDTWISDENKRKQYYRELISSGDRAALLKMVHALDKHKQEQQSSGKKFHQCDENFMRDAVKLLDAEFSLVLNMEQSQVKEYIMGVLKAE